MSGPLKGIRILEFAGLGPGPFCGMMLADHGADVIRIARPGSQTRPSDPLQRSRRSIMINLKESDGVSLVKRLTKTVDGLIEGFRPGVMERLGLGPKELLDVNPKLVYGRMTGWGQSGPLAHAAGHDINYISLSGILHTCGRESGPPTPPVNYLGDFGGGGMMLAFGMVAALVAVKNGASGQVVDSAMTDGSALLMAMTWGMYEDGEWKDTRGVNRLDTGAYFYNTYETLDSKWISIGALEPQFYDLLLDKLDLKGDPAFEGGRDSGDWEALTVRLQKVFKERTRAEWCEILEGSDACFAPVLSLAEAPHHPHNRARGTFVTVGSAVQPAPAPRYSVTQTAAPREVSNARADTDQILESLGYDAAAIAELRSKAVLA